MVKTIRRLLPLFLLLTSALFGQASLVLSSGSSSLNLTLTSPAGSEPAGVQWMLSYSPGDIISINAVAAGAAAAANKSINCAAAGAGAYLCLLVGMNANPIQNGVVASVNVTLAAGVASTAIAVANPLGATGAGQSIGIAGVGGTKTGILSPVVSGLVCAPGSLTAGQSSTCTVTLSRTGGGTVTLSSNLPGLSVPSSVTVAAGATSATFTASAGAIAADQTATVTASMSGVSQTAFIALTTALTVNSLICLPSTLSAGGLSACTVTLSKNSGGTLALSSSTGALAVPSSVTVAAGSATATFTASAGAIAADQTATVTASMNGALQTASIGLTMPATVTSLVCAPSTLGSGGASTCTVNLSRNTGGTVMLSSDAGALALPASVVVAPGSSTATFRATAGAIAADQKATVTASMNGISRTAPVALTTALTVSSLVCAPALSTGASGACTVTLSRAGGGTVSLYSNTGALNTPVSVVVAAGATTATFAVTAGVIATDQVATLTASMNGASQTASIALTTPATVTSLACTPTALGAGAASTCTLTLSKNGGATVALSSSTGALTVPTVVVVPAGLTTAVFAVVAGAIPMDQTVAVLASLNGSSQVASIVLHPAAQGIITSLSCLPDASAAGVLDCAIQLTQGAPAGGMTVALQSSSARLQMPDSVRVPAGQQSAAFLIRVLPSDQDEQTQITALAQGAVRTIALSLVGLRPLALLLSKNVLPAGGWVEGEILLNSSNLPDSVQLALASTSPNLRLPASITARPGQTRILFKAYADAYANQQNAEISGQFGKTSVKAPIVVAGSGTPVLTLPGDLAARFGEEAAFTVSAIDPQGLTLVYAVDALPAGASFDPLSGKFAWTPGPSQAGIYDLTFTATNPAQASAAGHVKIAVDAGNPVLTGVRNAAAEKGPVCSPGSLASAQGRWLASKDADMADPAGGLTELNGARVKVNGQYVPVVYASRTRVDFVCPNLDPGTMLAVSVENAAGASDPVTVELEALAPALFSFDGSGSGQGMVYLAGTPQLAASRDYLALGQPAQSGDSLSVRSTGLGSPDGLPPTVLLGGIPVKVDSFRTIPGMAGVAEILIRVPPGIQEEDDVSLVVICRQQPGPADSTRRTRNPRVRSNSITIAIESARQ